MDMLKDLVEIILAFLVAWASYYGLALAFDTPMPIVSVVSDSMRPVLHRGDILVVTGEDEYEVGDIVIYQRPEIDYTIVHRIVAKTDEGYVIKGDNNAVPDPGFVHKSQILGKVRLAMPLLGYPRILLHLIGV